MKLEQTFTVQATPEVVWDALIDVERVAPCLPGAAVTGREEDGSYKGEFKVKLGPTTAAYSGVLKMTSVDAEAQVATMDARGTDKRGQGGATASIVSSVHPGDGGETRVDVVTDFAITGRLARFGRGGMIQDVANRLLREFAANLQAQLQADGADAAAQAAGTAEADPGGAEDASTSGEASTTDEAPAADGPAGSSPPPPPPPRPAPQAAAPASGNAILLGALMDRIKRDPRQLGLVIGFVLGVLAVRRRRRRG